MRIFICLLFILFPCFVIAGEDGEVVCDAVMKARSNAEVSAAYVPGVDVSGQSVAAADIKPDNPLPYFNGIEIPLTMDLAQKFNLNLPAFVEMSPDIAVLKVFSDGRVLFNGKDISGRVETYCSGKDVVVIEEKADGHKAPVPLSSGDKIEGAYPPEQSH